MAQWDIDSFVGIPKSLGIFVGSFNLSYRSTYSQNINQAQHVKLAGHDIHRLKHLYLGDGSLSLGLGIRCHVAFPAMGKVKPEHNFLNEEEMITWCDQILLPAQRAVCPAFVTQHHPRSFKEVKYWSKPKLESGEDRMKEDIRVRSTIQDTYLDSFWRQVIANAKRISGGFAKPVLLISGHDLKLHTQQETAAAAMERFGILLNAIFHDYEEYFEGSMWYDLGCETIATDLDKREAITLLPKTLCCSSWASLFRSPTGSAKLKTEKYPFQMTKDASTISFETTPSNIWQSQQGIMHGKFYASHKDVFTTPVKGYGPFDNEQLALLAFSDDGLQQLSKSLAKNNSLNRYKRETLKRMYSQCKDRVLCGLHETRTTTFGVRKEWRLNLARGCSMDVRSWDINPTSNSVEVRCGRKSGELSVVEGSTDWCKMLVMADGRPGLASGRGEADVCTTHLPFWILPTTEVSRFVESNLLRWMWVLEALAVQIEPVPHLPIVSLEAQLRNNAMMTAMLKMLSTTAGSRDPSRNKLIWQGSWRIKSRPLAAEAIDSGVDDESRSSAKEKVRWGLDMKTSLAEHGMAWMRDDLIDWVGLCFTPAAMKRLPFRHWRMKRPDQRKVKGCGQKVYEALNATATVQNRFRSLFRSRSIADAEARVAHAVEVGAQLVVCGFVQEVWKTLSERMEETRRQKRAGLHVDILSRLDEVELAGYCGLTLEMVERALGKPCTIAWPRKAGSSGPGDRQVHLQGYDDGSWADKIQAFFGLDDQAVGAKKRRWDRLPYRMLFNRLQVIVKEEADEQARLSLVQAVRRTATEMIRVAPLYSVDSFSVLNQTSSFQSERRRELVGEMSLVERTQWMMCYLGGELGHEIARVQALRNKIDAEKLSALCEMLAKKVRRSVRHGKLRLVRDWEQEWLGKWALDHVQKGIGGMITMEEAKGFMQEVERQIQEESEGV